MYAHAQFDAIWAEAYRRLTVRISAATSERRRLGAWHHRHAMQINYHFLRNKWETAREDVLICKCCGKIASCCYVEPTRQQMVDAQLCFACNHWTQFANARVAVNRLIIDGEVYTHAERMPPGTPFLGHGGREFHWKMIGDPDEHVFSTNNMWSGGTIPEEFRAMCPDNAVLVEGFHAPYITP